MDEAQENRCYELEIGEQLEPLEQCEEPKYGSESPKALRCLKEGNDIFYNQKKICFDVDKTLPDACKESVRPIAVVVSCSDNRVSPEFVFAQSIGRLFVIRVAGNTIDASAMGSLEYALEFLKAPLIVVMGHQDCGAVKGAVKALKDQNTSFRGSISAIIEPILPAVINAGKNRHDANLCAVENVKRVVESLKNSPEPMLSSRIKKGMIVAGAYYKLEGKVDFL